MASTHRDTCTHAHTHRCIHTFMHTCMYIHTPKHAHMNTHTCTHTCTHTYTHMHAHVHTCKHARMHTYTYTQAHTCTHIDTYTRLPQSLRFYSHRLLQEKDSENKPEFPNLPWDSSPGSFPQPWDSLTWKHRALQPGTGLEPREDTLALTYLPLESKKERREAMLSLHLRSDSPAIQSSTARRF